MLRGKLLAGIIIVAVIAGCAKKKVQNDEEFSQNSKKTVQNQSSTSDIFEEFYKDDNTSETSTPEPKQKQAAAKAASQPAVTGFSDNGRYVVQVSTLGSRLLADRLVQQLDARGFPAYVAEVQNPTPQLEGTYYRVRIGNFSQISSARAFGDETLKPLGYDFWVDNKSNDNIGIIGSGFGSSTPTSDFGTSTYQYNTQTYEQPASPPVDYSPAPTTAEPISDFSSDAATAAPVEPAPAPAQVAPEVNNSGAATAAQPQSIPLDEEW